MANGSRVSCGRLARGPKSIGRGSVPARANHFASLKAITARHLQAHVRQPPAGGTSEATDSRIGTRRTRRSGNTCLRCLLPLRFVAAQQPATEPRDASALLMDVSGI